MFENIQRRKRKKPVWPWIVLAVLVLAVLALGAFHVVKTANDYTVVVIMNDRSEITVEYGVEFTDPGAIAWRQGKLYNDEKIDLKVQVSSDLDLSKVGTYSITYSAEFEGITATQTRTVYVVDTVAPVIELIGDPGAFTLPGHEYVEEGFSAFDNYDGDLTDKVSRVIKDGIVTYTVTDSSGNATTMTREIVYNDITAPVITLKGETSITITEGDTWTEPGFSATDDALDDVTDRVLVDGTVDVNTPGTYTITYKVTDDYNNEAAAQRVVVVEALPPPAPPPVVEPEDTPGDTPADPNGKVIYLTFDDGPSQYTQELLAVLAKYDVKATFFVCNTSYKSVLADIAAGGHSLAIHSMSHNYNKIYASEEAFMEDILAVQSMIYEYTGITTTLMRFPGGSSNRVSKFNPGIMTRLTALVEAQGFHYFDWNVDSDDAGNANTADEVYRNVINGVKNKKNSIVLQHDIRGYSVDAVERIIQWGIQNGYTFKALDENSPTAHHGVRN